MCNPVICMCFVILAAGAAGAAGAAAGLPVVPAGIDPAVYNTTGDNRNVLELHASVHYSCTYPNDPKTTKDVQASARTKAEAGQHDPINIPANQCDLGYNCEVRCDSCDAGNEGSFAWFCGGIESHVNGSGYMKRARASYQGGDSCDLSIGENFFQTIQLGVESGTFVQPHGHIGRYNTTSCSVDQPAHHCVAHQPEFSGPYCSCDWSAPDWSTCNVLHGEKHCCTWEPTIEVISAEFKWYKPGEK